MRFTLLIFLLIPLIAGCSSDADNPSPDTTDDTPAPTATIGLNDRLELEQELESMQAAQQQIETIWRDLQAGEQVSCATELLRRSGPARFQQQGDSVYTILYQAALEIETSVQIWEQECSNPRPMPPADIINRGLTSALAAKTQLQDATQALFPAALPSDN